MFGWWENGGNKRREKWVFGGMGFLDFFAMWDFESSNLRWSVICFVVFVCGLVYLIAEKGKEYEN